VGFTKYFVVRFLILCSKSHLLTPAKSTNAVSFYTTCDNGNSHSKLNTDNHGSMTLSTCSFRALCSTLLASYWFNLAPLHHKHLHLSHNSCRPCHFHHLHGTPPSTPSLLSAAHACCDSEISNWSASMTS
jgi:hypothetical protein